MAPFLEKAAKVKTVLRLHESLPEPVGEDPEVEVFLDEFGEGEKVTFRKALCAILDDFEVPRGFQNEPKNISHASPPLPGDVAVWARCPWGPSGSNSEAFLKVPGA